MFTWSTKVRKKKKKNEKRKNRKIAYLSSNISTFTLKIEIDIFKNMPSTRNIKYSDIDRLTIKEWKDTASKYESKESRID